ncbi:hypothetical protein [Caulobacter sp. NIBR1757]|uniref:hypothetical protein n=1 Tax=Caulobacter sp. NIBR1757 TaxID=3016000 RepID=UPI0032AE946F
MCHAVFGGQQHAGGGAAIIDAQALEGVAHMVGDGVVGETQLLADLLAGQVLADQQQYLALACGQALEFSVGVIAVAAHVTSSKLSPSRARAAAAPKTPGCNHNAVLAAA